MWIIIRTPLTRLSTGCFWRWRFWQYQVCQWNLEDIICTYVATRGTIKIMPIPIIFMKGLARSFSSLSNSTCAGRSSILLDDEGFALSREARITSYHMLGRCYKRRSRQEQLSVEPSLIHTQHKNISLILFSCEPSSLVHTDSFYYNETI